MKAVGYLVVAAALTVAAAPAVFAGTPDPLAKYMPKTLSPSQDEKDILKFCIDYRDREIKNIPAIASGQTAYTSDGAELKYYDACLRAHRARDKAKPAE